MTAPAGDPDKTARIDTAARRAHRQRGADDQFAPGAVVAERYRIGLVMYELFTGKRGHDAHTLKERVRDITTDIATPSAVIRDIDQAVERIILRCLSNDPAQRPRSAREAIEYLPGGDPLAAALAARRPTADARRPGRFHEGAR